MKEHFIKIMGYYTYILQIRSNTITSHNLLLFKYDINIKKPKITAHAFFSAKTVLFFFA